MRLPNGRSTIPQWSFASNVPMPIGELSMFLFESRNELQLMKRIRWWPRKHEPNLKWTWQKLKFHCFITLHVCMILKRTKFSTLFILSFMNQTSNTYLKWFPFQNIWRNRLQENQQTWLLLHHTRRSSSTPSHSRRAHARRMRPQSNIPEIPWSPYNRNSRKSQSKSSSKCYGRMP